MDPAWHLELETMLAKLPGLKVLRLTLDRFYRSDEEKRDDPTHIAKESASGFIGLDRRMDFATCLDIGVLHTVILEGSATVTEIVDLMSIPSVTTIEASGVLTLQKLDWKDVRPKSSNVKVLGLAIGKRNGPGIYDIEIGILRQLLSIPKALKDLRVVAPLQKMNSRHLHHLAGGRRTAEPLSPQELVEAFKEVKDSLVYLTLEVSISAFWKADPNRVTHDRTVLDLSSFKQLKHLATDAVCFWPADTSSTALLGLQNHLLATPEALDLSTLILQWNGNFPNDSNLRAADTESYIANKHLGWLADFLRSVPVALPRLRRFKLSTGRLGRKARTGASVCYASTWNHCR
ncbi:hypothetical protein NA57DRAFT_71075 [Rhizodiscina lignyota]|uniref:Uncharacterized protein n=1 Tax=Rhizodiscina lignyota TaxID=1504668 RepID=A0A9P4IRN4_9PEZI|nr:hypothetical protein NA57DRAFT_71075 [Rhizodiscina lignyota]